MIFFTVFAFGFLYEDPSPRLKWYVWLFVFAIGVGFGTTWVEGWAEGECQLINAIYDIGLLLAIVLVTRKHGVKIKDHPFFCILIVLCITFFIGVVIWGAVYGLLPYYPYFKEPPS
jgi:quinol-cytochrome oxidoreductase complex cytochrome b subunit